jgi:hypothetical protein
VLPNSWFFPKGLDFPRILVCFVRCFSELVSSICAMLDPYCDNMFMHACLKKQLIVVHGWAEQSCKSFHNIDSFCLLCLVLCSLSCLVSFCVCVFIMLEL